MSAVRMGGGRQSREIYSSSSKAKDEKPRNGLFFFLIPSCETEPTAVKKEDFKSEKKVVATRC